MKLRDRILSYNFDKIQATNTYLESGIDATTEELIACFQAPLATNELSTLRYFLRDGLSSDLPIVEQIRLALGASDLPKVMLKRLLTSPSSERNILVDAMRANMPGHKESFHAAFRHFRDTDPLLLPILLREARWTGATEGLELDWELLESPCYLSRWSLADCNPNLDLLAKMRDDSHPRVRREAEYRLALLLQEETYHEFSKAENRQRRKEIEAIKPLTFSDLSSNSGA